MIYFAYGSNMSAARLKKRIPSAVKIETGFLYSHKLAFHKVGKKDGSGKCDAFETGNTEDYLAGVLYQINPEDRGLLDEIEGRGYGYEVKNVKIKTSLENESMAFTYYATNINTNLQPYHWYKHHVITGAKENDLSCEYINRIKSVESIKDPDSANAEKELSIYNELPRSRASRNYLIKTGFPLN